MLSIIIGLLLAAGGILWLTKGGAWDEFLIVCQGSLPVIFAFVGLIAIAAGFSSIKEKAAEKKEEKKEEAKPEEKKE